jgi:hypothetical protein
MRLPVRVVDIGLDIDGRKIVIAVGDGRRSVP